MRLHVISGAFAAKCSRTSQIIETDGLAAGGSDDMMLKAVESPEANLACMDIGQPSTNSKSANPAVIAFILASGFFYVQPIGSPHNPAPMLPVSPSNLTFASSGRDELHGTRR